MIPYHKCIAAKLWQLTVLTALLSMAIMAIVILGTLKAFGWEIGTTESGLPIMLKMQSYQMDIIRIGGNALQVALGIWMIINPIKALVNKVKMAQQVDSAEASTIAVPPSKPSGSPR